MDLIHRAGCLHTFLKKLSGSPFTLRESAEGEISADSLVNGRGQRDPMSQEFIFARHGESIVNQTRTISNRISHYSPLTELGREQARQLLDSLRDRCIIAIYSSPLTLARETAEILAAGFGLPVEIADALREPDCGEIEGHSDEAAWRRHAAQEEAWNTGKSEYRIPGGKSFDDVRGRFVPFVNRVLVERRDEAGSVVMVSHGSVLVHTLPLLLSNIQPDLARTNPFGNCSYVAAKSTELGLTGVEWCGKPI